MSTAEMVGLGLGGFGVLATVGGWIFVLGKLVGVMGRLSESVDHLTDKLDGMNGRLMVVEDRTSRELRS